MILKLCSTQYNQKSLSLFLKKYVSLVSQRYFASTKVTYYNYPFALWLLSPIPPATGSTWVEECARQSRYRPHRKDNLPCSSNRCSEGGLPLPLPRLDHVPGSASFPPQSALAQLWRTRFVARRRSSCGSGKSFQHRELRTAFSSAVQKRSWPKGGGGAGGGGKGAEDAPGGHGRCGGGLPGWSAARERLLLLFQVSRLGLREWAGAASRRAGAWRSPPPALGLLGVFHPCPTPLPQCVVLHSLLRPSTSSPKASSAFPRQWRLLLLEVWEEAAASSL